MPFVEVFAPHGSVGPEQQARIGNLLVAEVMRVEGTTSTEAPRSSSWHDVAYWTVGGQPTDAREPAHYVVRISVPNTSMTDDKRADIVARVSEVLDAAGPHRFQQRRRRLTAWVQIQEFVNPDGQVVRFAEIAAGGLN
jgi:hypothetical protein